ncbi:MAG: hypothetical protein K0Q68_2306 [Moraxellaceae bacterium]|nr:hypothetical protein [Moraxellaceae bacterium]
MNKSELLPPQDRELAATLRDTLERKATQSDPLLEAALAATRAQIAARPSRQIRHPWWLAGGFAVAASVAMLVVGLPAQESSSATPGNTVAESVAMPDADLQFLQDMDLLVAMNERGS